MITKTQILQVEGLTAQTLLELFSSVNKRLGELGARVSPPDQTVFLTREEVGRFLKISLPTVWAWSKQGILKPHRLGNQVRYIESEVLQAAQATKKGGALQ